RMGEAPRWPAVSLPARAGRSGRTRRGLARGAYRDLRNEVKTVVRVVPTRPRRLDDKPLHLYPLLFSVSLNRTRSGASLRLCRVRWGGGREDGRRGKVDFRGLD